MVLRNEANDKQKEIGLSICVVAKKKTADIKMRQQFRIQRRRFNLIPTAKNSSKLSASLVATDVSPWAGHAGA
jgi:hypothetical protein